MATPLSLFSGGLPGGPPAPATTPGGGGPINYMSLFGLGSGVPYGTKPAGSLTSTTAGENLQGAPNLTALTNLINSLNIDAQTKSNAARIPGATDLETTSSKNIGSELQGQLPQDVVNLLAEQAAERGIGTGNNNFLQQLGLNSLQLEQLGQQNLTTALGRNPGARIFDPTTQLLTPPQAGNLNNNAFSLNPRNPPTWLNFGGGPKGYNGGGGGNVSDWFTQALNTITGGQQPLGGGGTTTAPNSPLGADDWWNTFGGGQYDNTAYGQNVNDPNTWIDSVDTSGAYG